MANRLYHAKMALETENGMRDKIMYLSFIAAKNDYIAASRRAFDCGLAAASGGNVSVRIPGCDQMLVKPSGITLGEAAEDNLLITDLYGNVLEGNLKPTKETILHGGLYRRDAHIGAVVHAHPVYAMLCAGRFTEMPLVTKQMKQLMQGPVPVCKLQSNTVTEEGMRTVLAMLDARPDACCFLLEEHGVVAFAATAREAEFCAELVEENARVCWESTR